MHCIHMRSSYINQYSSVKAKTLCQSPFFERRRKVATLREASANAQRLQELDAKSRKKCLTQAYCYIKTPTLLVQGLIILYTNS